MTWLDLNADLGEGIGNDEAMLEIVSSANIACGGHAGDLVSMVVALRAAKAHGVTVGAHPGFADPETFGRRRLVLPPEELDATVRGQVRDLAERAVGAVVIGMAPLARVPALPRDRLKRTARAQPR